MRTMFARGGLGLLAVGSAGVALALPTAFLGKQIESPRRPAVPAEAEPTVIHVAAPPRTRSSRPAVAALKVSPPAPASVRPVLVPARPAPAQHSRPAPRRPAEEQVDVYERPEPQAPSAPVLTAALPSPEPVGGSAVRAATSVTVTPEPHAEPERKPKRRPSAKPKPKQAATPRHQVKTNHEPSPKGRSVPTRPPAPVPEAEAAGPEVGEARPPDEPAQDKPEGGKPEHGKPEHGQPEHSPGRDKPDKP